MAVDSQGWLDWAVKLPATVNHVNAGTNPVKGIFFHSAEGFATTLLDPQSKWGYNGDLSWHLTNTLDGKLYQHYPFTARCWHATAANNEFVGMENEGRTPTDAQGNPIPPGPPLNAAQIANAKRVIADLSAWKGWTPERPFDVNDKTATLYQHGEVTRFGGTGSSCPNGRIPWDLILATEDYGPMNLNADGSDRIVSEGPYIIIYRKNAPIFRFGGDSLGEMQKNFGGTWYSLAHLKQDDDPGPGQQSPAVWSSTLTD